LGTKGDVSTDGAKGVADAGAGIKEIKLQAMRKLYFGLAYMPDLKPYYTALKTELKTLFAAAGIEIEGPTLDDVKIENRDFITGDDATSLAGTAEVKPAVEDTKRGLWMRLCLVKRLLNAKKEQKKQLDKFESDADPRLFRADRDFGVKIELGAESKERFIPADALETLKVAFDKPPAPIALKAPDDCTFSFSDERTCVMRLTHAGARALIAKHVGDQGKASLKVSFADDDAPSRTGTFFKSRIKPDGEGALKIELLFGVAMAKAVRDNIRPSNISLQLVTLGAELTPGSGFSITVEDEGRRVKARITDATINAMLTEGLKKEKPYGNLTIDYAGYVWSFLTGVSKVANISIAVGKVKDDLVAQFGANAANLEDRVKATLVRVIAHEVCHAIRGVQTSARGLSHGSWYPSSNGGLATDPIGHCNTNTDLLDAAKKLLNHTDAAYRKLYEEKKAKIYAPKKNTAPCVMFHTFWPSHWYEVEFCEKCLKQMRALPLDKKSLKAAGFDMVT
jgi:hypothetical protein